MILYSQFIRSGREDSYSKSKLVNPTESYTEINYRIKPTLDKLPREEELYE